MADNLNQEQEPIKSEPLFLGFASPPTLMGAPYPFTVATVLIGVILFLLLKNPFVMIVMAPMMLVGRLIVKRDPYGIQALTQNFKLRTKLLPRSRAWNKPCSFQIVTIAPLETAKPKHKLF